MKSSDPTNLIKLETAIRDCKTLFNEVENYDIQMIDLNGEKGTIKKIYESLSGIPGVEYTGRSKVMSLIQPRLFVMWDSYIRKHYGIQINDSEAYIQFLKMMQQEVKEVKWTVKTATLAKAIDEYNYVKYTFPELEKIRTKRK